MSENIKIRWLVDDEQTKIAPKTLATQIINENGTRFKDTIETAIANVESGVTAHASNNEIHVTAEEKEAWNNIEVPSLDGYATEDYVTNLYTKLNSNTILGFYCIEDVTIITNGISKVYPANSNVEIAFIEDDVWEIVPTSNNSILALTAFPGALGTFYPWLEGVAQFSNILFDMNDEAMYSKWSQGNQGSYHVQKAQYVNCIFWSDNPYISDVSKRTNYTLTHTSQLPLCYSTIPDNTFKAFYLAFGVNSDPNWGNQLYKDSFAKATWATQVFSYYGASTIGIVGHDDPDFNIVLPKDCRGLMFDARHIQNAGTFDAVNVTNFGAKSGSWREAFGFCISLKRLYIKNLKVSLNLSWSPIDYDSISYIISAAANTNAITISVSPYTYNLLSQSDFDLAASKNITIALLTTNYTEDKRLGAIANKADKTYVDSQIANLINSAPETLDTLGELATALNENKDIVDALNESIINKQNKNVIVYRDSSTEKASMTAPEVMEKVRAGDNLYYTDNLSSGTLHPYLEGSDTGVFFYSNYIDNDRVIGTGVLINAEGNITTETYQLEHLKDTVIHITSAERNRWNDTYTKAETDTLLEAKKNKDLIVTYQSGSTFGVTHSSGEIYEAVQNGTTVYFQKNTELLNLMEITEDYATFFMFYMSMDGKPRQKVVVISGSSIMLDQDDTYNYATTAELNNKADKTSLNSYYNKTEVDNLLASVGSSDDVLVKTAQTLTDEELTQVRSNLKFIGKDVAGQTFTIDGTEFTASANAEIFGDYANNIAVGQWSIAEGSGTVAKGRASHAEGAMTQALNDGCHTEGYQTKATGYWSHAEGELTIVSSYASHAEGSYCTLPNGTKRYGTAAGYASHIEGGGCHATGSCSHAEGLATTVSGAQSHAEGRYTIAAGGAQHVEGIANIEDTEDKYIHIAGNGTFDNRSNAYTLDWNGNGWFAGTVETSSVILRSSTPGSTKKFRLTIDDDGVLSTEEVVE